MKLKYIGLKEDGERAFQEKTGIEWFPGDVHDITDKAICRLLLEHPTLWEPVTGEDVGLTLSAAAPKQPKSSGPASDEDVDDQMDAEEKTRKQAEADAAAKALAEEAAAGEKAAGKKKAAAGEKAA